MQSFPNFDQGPERIGADGAHGLQRGENGSAADEWFTIDPNVGREKRGDLMCEPLFVSNPFQKLSFEWRQRLEFCAVEQVLSVIDKAHGAKYPDLGFGSSYSKTGFVIRDPHSEGEQALRAFLREARKSSGMRQADLAAQLRVPQSFVSKYESGERLLTFLETLAILGELGVPVENLLLHLTSTNHETRSSLH